MLQIVVPACNDLWDERNECFITTKEQRLTLEHSLVSISKWESKWKRPFFKEPPATIDELLDYIKFMTLTQNVDPNVYLAIPVSVIDEIKAYMEDTMTATWFSNINDKPNHRIITSELVYCWMFQLQIPMECQKWHINRLMTLIRVCSEENKPAKKMSPAETRARHRQINAMRRKSRKIK